MRLFLYTLFFAAAVCFTTSAKSQSLIENGKFNNPGDPLKGWVTDYAWSGNSYYVGNKEHVSVASDGGRSVVKFTSAGTGGEKMESSPFPFEPGFKYICDVEVKGDYRLYFAGYQWAPGVHPHENPAIGELRMIYQSKAATGTAQSMKHVKFELPGVALSESALEHIKKVRLLTVYFFMPGAGEVADVVVTKIADPSMNFHQ